MPGPATHPETLAALLHRVFGHTAFRPHQQQVCEAAAAGRDVLLVMPTGAGKSLCYQLPALARRASPGQGTALVISPLIALMDDQAAKLTSLGLHVARIHSGLSREDARQACRDYLAGTLDFLFIAPERMRVPGFADMLAKRKPALVAIDEAHCISQWGHDFRPDYRALGQHLQALRPSPVLALTATATPRVQADIIRQLALNDPAVFITGFRRTSLQVEVLDLSKPRRTEFARKLLADRNARPAIVYAPSRKAAEELAGELSRRFPAAAYHAGLDPGTRDRVQRAFLTGELDVVVATVAFGMGVDKADVRTVLHIALPGSVEAFYQEIGRAGRDGLPSRTVLLYSFADRKTQEFLLDRSYPALTDLQRVAAALTGDPVAPEDLVRKLRLDAETVDRCIEKLLGLNAATVDMNGLVARAPEPVSQRIWADGYAAQLAFRRDQIDRMMAFAEGHTCRMEALIRHFGDREDGRGPCGLCDVCRPSETSMRQATAPERDLLRRILSAVAHRGTSTGKLHTELGGRRDRRDFDQLLDALARAGLLEITNDTFTNPEGREVTYRKVTATHEGRSPDEAALDTVWLRNEGKEEEAPRSKSSGKRSAKPKTFSRSDSRSSEQSGQASFEDTAPEPLTDGQEALFEQLREWRRAVADEARKPAFFVFSDRILRSIAVAAPQTLTALGRISGVGEAKLDTYGAAVLALCRGEAPHLLPGPAKGLRSTPEPDPNPDPNPDPSPDPSPAVEHSTTPARRGASRRDSARKHASHPESDAPDAIPANVVDLADLRLPPRNRPVMARAQTADTLALPLSSTQRALVEKLRTWRSERARQAGLPSFFIFSDSVLDTIAAAGPRSVDDLQNLRGVGPDKAHRFGPEILDLCRP